MVNLKLSNYIYGVKEEFIVYFDQILGAAHSKHWSKNAFSLFFCPKKLKKEEKA